MSSRRPLVSVIILNWNRRQEAAALIRQLKKQTFRDFETILVDNASQDDSVAYIRRFFPWVKLIEAKSNYALYGFNLGMRKARGDYFLLLPNDVVPAQNLIAKHLEKLKLNPRLGISCPTTYDLKTKKYLSPNRAKEGSNQEGYRVTYFDGAGICLRREVFARAGGYSRPYFICLEELEWAVRILRAGFEIACFTDVRVYHRKSKAAGEYRTRLGYYYCRNWLWFYLQYLPWRAIPDFWRLHGRSFFEKTGPEGVMRKQDCLRGILASLLLVPYYLGQRRPVSKAILARIKADLFPNPDHLYCQ